jgi:two-component system response regulator AtoC
LKRASTELPTPTPTPTPDSATRVELAHGADQQLYLLVVGDGVLATEPLPSIGVATVGRATNNDVCIEDASISREHATLHLDEPLRIEDAGSANGTWVREQRIEPNQQVAIQVDQAIRLGSVTVVVQRRTRQLRARRRRSHEYFESRLDEECARGLRRGSQFALLYLITSERSIDVEPAIISVLRADDIVAAYGPGEIELLLLDTDEGTVARVLERLEAAVARRSVSAKMGLAWFPRDGREPAALVANARASAHGVKVDRTEPADVVVIDPRMVALHELVSRVAAADISVLLQGETGTGKEVIAEQIHRQSARAANAFVKLNCAALTESLLESELFGHERGAFTGATSTKQGLLEVADGGVIFLDEVGEMHASTQAKLLRVLDEHKLMRVGGVTARDIDVRIVSATNRDLELEVERGNFRLDLLYRLNAMSILIPPLRERPSEIEPLANQFLRHTAAKYGRRAPKLSPAAIDALRSYSWPGNVRELRNVMERAMVMASGPSITAEDLPIETMRSTFASPSLTPPPFAALDDPDQGERQRIIAALDECGGNQTHAARLLGISRRALITRIERYEIRRPRKR